MALEEGDSQRRNLPTVCQIDVGAGVKKQLCAEVPTQDKRTDGSVKQTALVTKRRMINYTMNLTNI